MAKRHFSMIDMGITRACNMRCKFCTAIKTHGFEKMMTLEEFKAVVHKVENLIEEDKIVVKPPFISFGNVGEPLLHPHFMEMNQYARNCGWRTGIYTNGLLMTEKMIRNIYNNGGIDTVNVSITGIDTKIYKNFQGYGYKKADREKILKIVLNNIENLIKIRNERHENTKIAVNYIVTKGTILHIRKYIRVMAGLGVDEIRFTPLVDRPRKSKKIKVRCTRLDGILNIDENGDISPCNNDLCKNLSIGNITDEQWMDTYEALVCDMNNGKLSMLPDTCQVCDNVNFASFADYMSMSIKGYLKIRNHKVMWKESFLQYKKELWARIKWYYLERYV